MTACGSVGALMVGGRVVGQLKCELEAGHDEERAIRFGTVVPPDLRGATVIAYDAGANIYAGSPHRVVLEWADTEPVDLDLFDPAEHFDVDVPIPPAPRWILGDDAVPFESVPGRIMETPAPLNFPPTHLDRVDLYGEE